MQAAAAFPRLLLQAMFLAWWGATKDTANQRLATENRHLQKMAGKKATSIWDMSKEMLIEVALRELPNMTREVAKATRKGAFQHMIKKHRDATEVTPMLPKGLARMRHEELMREAQARGISTQDTTRRYSVKVREQLISDITEYEVARAHAVHADQEQTEADVTVDELKMEDFSPPPLGASPGASAACSQSHAAAGSPDMEIYDLLQQIRENPRAAALLRAEPELLRP